MNDQTEARKILARESRDLLEDPAFQQAILKIRQQLFDKMMAEEEPRKRDTIWAEIRALEWIPKQLTIFVNDQRMAEHSNARRFRPSG